jgi:hypothetical protein
MKRGNCFCLTLLVALCAGCLAPSPSNPGTAGPASRKTDPLQQMGFGLEVIRHVYRWHFDQSYVLEAGRLETIEVWTRRLHPKLDADDQSEYGEMWIPAVKTLVELKRAQYRVPELKLDIAERSFKVTRVTRQAQAPGPRRQYQVHDYGVNEVRDYLFATRAERVPISDTLRESARRLIADYLNKSHPEPFAEDQTFYISPLSSVCNEVWVFWETGRKLMLFTADMDLANPSFSQLSQLRMHVIDLDKDVVASTREVPGSNAFVTKDWVGRLFFNCILYGEKLVRTPAEINRRRAEAAARPASQ